MSLCRMRKKKEGAVRNKSSFWTLEIWLSKRFVSEETIFHGGGWRERG